MVKTIQDMFIRFDRIHERGRQTDGRTDGQTDRRTPRAQFCHAYAKHRAAKTECEQNEKMVEIRKT